MSQQLTNKNVDIVCVKKLSSEQIERCHKIGNKVLLNEKSASLTQFYIILNQILFFYVSSGTCMCSSIYYPRRQYYGWRMCHWTSTYALL